MVVRAVTWSDFEGVAAFRLHRYDQIDEDPDYGMVSNPSRPSPGELASWFGELHRAVLEGRAVCSVAVEDGTVVGLCSVRPEGNARETRHVGVLGVEVRDGYRGRGIGEALVRHALAACRGRFEEIYLSVLPVNDRAQRLYRRLGFRVYGTAPRAFRRGGRYHDFVLMALHLDGARPGRARGRGAGPRRQR
jgi:ribosomal protein S18 acetylase RimI-like enzyme